MTDPPDFSPFFFFRNYPFTLKGKCRPCAPLVSEKMGRLTYFTHEVSWDEFCCGFAPHKFNSIRFQLKTFTQFLSSLPALLAVITCQTVGLTGGNVDILLHSDWQNCSESVRSHWHQVWTSSVPNTESLLFSALQSQHLIHCLYMTFVLLSGCFRRLHCWKIHFWIRVLLKT